jgi:hypothetical protein
VKLERTVIGGQNSKEDWKVGEGAAVSFDSGKFSKWPSRKKPRPIKKIC